MKTIGILGGMSWESTLTYYEVMNTEVKRRLGGSHSAKIVMESFDYRELEILLEHHDWQTIGHVLSQSAKNLASIGAELLVIGANTMHIVAPEIKASSGLEIVHIAHATADAIKAKGIRKVALFGTSYTMESTMYPDILTGYGIEVVVPDQKGQETIHRTIYDELIKGVISSRSRDRFKAIATEMVSKEGIGGVILGCTEIPLLIKDGDMDVPVFDTTTIHAIHAVGRALANDQK
jgi:aspartate racemase